MKREHVTNADAVLIGEEFRNLFFPAWNDTVCTRRTSLRSVSNSLSGSGTEPLLAQLQLNIGKIRNIYPTTGKIFS